VVQSWARVCRGLLPAPQGGQQSLDGACAAMRPQGEDGLAKTIAWLPAHLGPLVRVHAQAPQVVQKLPALALAPPQVHAVAGRTEHQGMALAGAGHRAAGISQWRHLHPAHLVRREEARPA
jgi:hypothetical protein